MEKIIKNKILGRIIRTFNKKGKHIKSSFPDVAIKLEKFLSQRMSEIAKGKVDIKKGKKYEDVVSNEKAREWKRKVGLASKGRTHITSDKTKEKYICPRCGKEMEAKPTEVVCGYCGLKGKYEPEEEAKKVVSKIKN